MPCSSFVRRPPLQPPTHPFSPLAMPFIWTQFNGQLMELEVDCFDTVQEVKHKILNAYFRQPGDQMPLEEFSTISFGFELVAYSRTLKPSKGFKDDDELLDEVNEDWLICMFRTPEQ